MEIAANHNPTCQKPGRPFILATLDETKTAYAFRPGCGMWECEACKEVLRRKWVLIALFGAQTLLSAGKKLGFVTVTARGGKGRTQERSISQFAIAWPKLARRAKYHGCQPFDYLLVPELHQNGVVHYHLIGTTELPTRWWKDNSAQVGLGYMAKHKELQDVGWVVFYVSKYLGKDLGNKEWPDNLRRIRTSQNWPRPPEFKDERAWEYEVYRERHNILWELDVLRGSGWTVTASEAVTMSQD